MNKIPESQPTIIDSKSRTILFAYLVKRKNNNEDLYPNNIVSILHIGNKRDEIYRHIGYLDEINNVASEVFLVLRDCLFYLDIDEFEAINARRRLDEACNHISKRPPMGYYVMLKEDMNYRLELHIDATSAIWLHPMINLSNDNFQNTSLKELRNTKYIVGGK